MVKREEDLMDAEDAGEASPADRLKTVPRCGARTRRGGRCEAPAMPNGRCRMHGGKSTGPRTPEGLERLRAARTKTGLHSAEMVELRRSLAALRRAARG